jgi:hypothetical protein
MRGKEGIGKSTLSKMIFKCLPEDLIIENLSSEALHSKFNAEIENKVFVCIEENHSTNVSEWTKQASNLKLWCTGQNLQCEAKGKDRKTIPNLLNILVNTNETTIVKECGIGRRFFIADLSDKRKGDIPYWKRLYAVIEDTEFQQYFFNYYAQIVYEPTFDTREIPYTVNKNIQAVLEKKSKEPIGYMIYEVFYKNNLGISTTTITEQLSEYATFAMDENENYRHSEEFGLRTSAEHSLQVWLEKVNKKSTITFSGTYFRYMYQLFCKVQNGEQCQKYTSFAFYKKLEEMGFDLYDYEIKGNSYKGYSNISYEQVKSILKNLEFITN